MGRRMRFGLHLWSLPDQGWAEKLRRYERLGYSTITLTDHVVVPQWEPVAALGAIAAVTEAVTVGPLVLDMGLRDPVLTAKSAATLHQLSEGRLELGVGAGYVARNFSASGVPFHPGSARLLRLREAVALMRGLWTQPTTDFHGECFEVVDSPMAAAEPVHPRLLVGGGGPSLLRYAGSVSDTASLIARQETGEWSIRDSLSDSTVPAMVEKASWVRKGAASSGRDPGEVQLHTMVAKVIVGDRPGPAIDREVATVGVTRADLAASTLYLCGRGDEIRDELSEWRERIGLSYVSFFDPGEDQIDYLAEEVVGKL